MNAIEETVAAATGVSIPTEVITAHAQMVSNYATRGRVGLLMNVTEKTEGAAIDVSIPLEVIIAHVHEVFD